MAQMYDVRALEADLLKWAADRTTYVRAAVQLLIDHDHWLRNGHFRREAVDYFTDGTVVIRWDQARAAFDAGTFDLASSSERAVLDFAIALGSNHYRLASLDEWNRRAIARALIAAAGIAK